MAQTGELKVDTLVIAVDPLGRRNQPALGRHR